MRLENAVDRQAELTLVHWEGVPAEGGDPISIASPRLTRGSRLAKSNRLIRAHVEKPISEHSNTIAQAAILKFQRNGCATQVITAGELRQHPTYAKNTNLPRIMAKAGRELTRDFQIHFVEQSLETGKSKEQGGAVFSWRSYENGVLVLTFNPALLQYLSTENHQYQFCWSEFAQLPSFYSQRLYEYLKSEADFSGAPTWRTLDHGTLRGITVGANSKLYSPPGEFNRHVVKRAIREINAAGRLTIMSHKSERNARGELTHRFMFKSNGAEERVPQLPPLQRALYLYLVSLEYNRQDGLRIVESEPFDVILDVIARYEHQLDQYTAAPKGRPPSPGFIRAGIADRYRIVDEDERKKRVASLQRKLAENTWGMLGPESRIQAYQGFTAHLETLRDPMTLKLWNTACKSGSSWVFTAHQVGAFPTRFYAWLFANLSAASELAATA